MKLSRLIICERNNSKLTFEFKTCQRVNLGSLGLSSLGPFCPTTGNLSYTQI
ncbi:hypothetical protein HanRHA438_Chr15g0732381 [Helianthus annuus]|nr:hypothetical protein HanRHA438_Chr15g0732381 [Helianthus annuus]